MTTASTPTTVAVTGATGRIGGAVARLLHGDGVRPRLLVRDPTRVSHWADDVAVAGYGDRRAATDALARL